MNAAALPRPAPAAGAAPPRDGALDANLRLDAARSEFLLAPSAATRRALYEAYRDFLDAFLGAPRFAADQDERHRQLADFAKRIGLNLETMRCNAA